MKWRLRTLRKTDGPVVERLFGSRGACGGCWCMWWRLARGGKLWEESKGEKNRHAFLDLIAAGKVHAILAFEGKEPVGWCSFGPRPSFPRLTRSRVLARDVGEGTWTIACYFLAPAARGRGLGQALLEAARKEAVKLGAKEVEGIPYAVKGKAKAPAVFAFTGVPAMYDKAGFSRLKRPKGMRPIYVAEAR
ncbi:MAG: GNAT family N-acetyltransferase [Alphaproteobacteria bacterium]|nr:GNAT family N-acetyltransferase [Alphaproteobacteria bacterium]